MIAMLLTKVSIKIDQRYSGTGTEGVPFPLLFYEMIHHGSFY